jgi:hypothetical protein
MGFVSVEEAYPVFARLFVIEFVFGKVPK